MFINCSASSSDCTGPRNMKGPASGWRSYSELSIVTADGSGPSRRSGRARPSISHLRKKLMTEHSIEILLVEDNPSDVQLTLHVFNKHRLSNRVHLVRDG